VDNLRSPPATTTRFSSPAATGASAPIPRRACGVGGVRGFCFAFSGGPSNSYLVLASLLEYPIEI
jgi:hypothetical protein